MQKAEKDEKLVVFESRKLVENADLHKSVLNKITTAEE